MNGCTHRHACQMLTGLLTAAYLKELLPIRIGHHCWLANVCDKSSIQRVQRILVGCLPNKCTSTRVISLSIYHTFLVALQCGWLTRASRRLDDWRRPWSTHIEVGSNIHQGPVQLVLGFFKFRMQWLADFLELMSYRLFVRASCTGSVRTPIRSCLLK